MFKPISYFNVFVGYEQLFASVQNRIYFSIFCHFLTVFRSESQLLTKKVIYNQNHCFILEYLEFTAISLFIYMEFNYAHTFATGKGIS